MTRKIILFIIIVMLYLCGVGVRFYVFHAQERAVAGEIPFTLESALQFRHIEMICSEGSLPEHDFGVEAPAGVNIKQTYTIFAEYFYACLAGCLPAEWSLTARVRWIALLWFCMGIPCMVLWVRGVSRSWAGGIAAGFLYAVSLAAVIRSTGQELSHENFALPLLIGHLACMAWSRGEEVSEWGRHVLYVMAGLLLAGAMLSWDMIQYYLYLWIIFAGIDAVKGTLYENNARFRGFVVPFLFVLAAVVLNPYMRSHGMLYSPLMFAGLIIIILRGYSEKGKRHIILRIVVLLGGVVLSLIISQAYGSSYGHFAQLLYAKLRFLNVKPPDPEALNFIQRIMWTPALNSATWTLTFNLFPASMLLSIAAVIGLILNQRACRKYDTVQIIFLYVITIPVYVLFVRFHVYAVVFAVALTGCWLGSTAAWSMKRWIVSILFLAGALIETSQVLYQPLRWGRPGIYYDDLQELTGWLKTHLKQQTVLANFGTSASILAYTGNPVVLHPKFEAEKIRQDVEQYGNMLFKENEKELRNWADRFGVEYYVYSMGEFASVHPERQMRYFVDALNPPPTASARMFEQKPDECRYFKPVWSNRKYRVFDMLTVEEELAGMELSAQAYESLCSGHLDVAQQLAEEALKLDIYNEQARQVIVHVTRLEEQGVQLD